MANPKHLQLLHKGVEAWNAWRSEHPDIIPDLDQADLSGLDLREVNLCDTNLIGANLAEARLQKAMLNGANLCESNLTDAELEEAKLNGAFLIGADLTRANLKEANLTGANFSLAHLQDATLTGADFKGAIFSGTHLRGTRLAIDQKQLIGGAQFYLEVFPAELDEIDQRRKLLHGSKDSSALGESYRDWLVSASNKSTSQEAFKPDLTGLAISGGGIRSATFALGAIQSLHQYGLFKHIDYLSTVSGGGYIGSCMTAAIHAISTPESKTEGASPAVQSDVESPEKSSEKAARTTPYDGRFPFRYKTGDQEPAIIHHLRNNSKYLTSGGLVSALQLPTTLLRGILANSWALLLYVFFAVFVLEWILEYWLPLVRSLDENTLEQYIVRIGVLSLVLMVISYPILERIENWRIGRIQSSKDATLRASTKLRARYGAITAGFMLAGAGCLLWVWLPRWWKALQDGLQPILDNTTLSFLFFGGAVLAAGIILVFVRSLRKYVFLFGISALTLALLFFVFWRCYLFWDLWIDLNVASGDALRIIALLVLIGIILYTEGNYNLNNSSMHRFYRDRLSNAYLVSEKAYGELEFASELKLSELRKEPSIAPYHILNVALNLQGSNPEDLRGRNADFFFFSSKYIGGFRTGFCRTEEMERNDPHVNLGTAMAISGAAASPNMGVFTLRAVTVLMTLLNIRMGYWLPNPKFITTAYMAIRPQEKSLAAVWANARNWFKKKYAVGPRKLITEALGRPSEKGWAVNLSDGGHIENLGLYELLRRRCKYIIAIDGEADPDISFGSLLQLIRYARIDMGIEIDIDLRDLGLRKSNQTHELANIKDIEFEDNRLKIELNDIESQTGRLSKKHWALGTIKYGGGQEGRLLYIKATMSEQVEHNYIQAYRKAHPLFPHESTADQSFDEAQFEVYRELGYQSGRSFFRDYFDNKGIDARNLKSKDLGDLWSGKWQIDNR